MAAESAAAARKPNGARKWLCGSRCPCPSSNPTIRGPGMAFRLAFLTGVKNPAIERRWRVRYSGNAQLNRPSTQHGCHLPDCLAQRLVYECASSNGATGPAPRPGSKPGLLLERTAERRLGVITHF